MEFYLKNSNSNKNLLTLWILFPSLTCILYNNKIPRNSEMGSLLKSKEIIHNSFNIIRSIFPHIHALHRANEWHDSF